MTTGEKIAKLRKENNYTQEQLAQLLGVSRQSISKYESDVAYPETDKLIQLGEIFDCSLDYLLRDGVEEKNNEYSAKPVTNEQEKSTEEAVEQAVKNALDKVRTFDKKSKKMVGNLPLWHIGKNAKGIFAIGITARGVVSIGFASVGVVSFGLASVGILALGVLAVGILALGSLAAGAVVCGGVCAGILALGGVAVGDFAFGGFAVGDYFAWGDIARGMHAIGKTDAQGQCFEYLGELTSEAKVQLMQSMYQNVPAIFHWIVRLIEIIL